MYFSGFSDGLDSVEGIDSSGAKAPDTGGDCLPFSHLEDRRFEILVFRLKTVEHSAEGNRVSLMQGVGERGRDVVVYSASGKVKEIVQCKKYESRLDAPSVRKEFVKLAIHNYLDPTVLGTTGVIYELWCPGGLTEPAAIFIDTWPSKWNAVTLTEDAITVIKQYAAFKDLDWHKIGEKVISEFQKRITPVRIDGVIMTERIRNIPPIYEAFFEGKLVMKKDDVFEAMRDFLTKSGISQLTDEDAKHIADRFTSFAADKRFVHLSGYVMGLPMELVKRFKPDEFQSFVTCAVQATTGITHTVISACSRLSWEAATEFKDKVNPLDKNITMVLVQTLTMSALSRINGMLLPNLKLQPNLSTYNKKTLRERLEHHVREMWESYQKCLSGYNPAHHPFGSDEEFRSRIAKHAIDGATTREEFEERLLRAVEVHFDDINTCYMNYMSLVPEEILVVTDTMTVFDNRKLLDRMVETIRTIDPKSIKPKST